MALPRTASTKTVDKEDVIVSRVTSMAGRGDLQEETGNCLYAFSDVDLRLLLNVSKSTLRSLISSRELDPNDLETICWNWYKRIRSGKYVRQWPINQPQRVKDAAEEVDRKILARQKKKRLEYQSPDGTKRHIDLPDPDEI